MDDGDVGGLNATVPHSARIWNYWLGGKDNYASDRELGDQIQAMDPAIVQIARANRDFLRRSVTALVTECGVRQFLDIGTGLPSTDNTHEVAQRAAANARIVYVDNDPLVLSHARALLASNPEGTCAYLDADVRDPDAILAGAADVLDFRRPVALMMLGVIAHVTDDETAYAIVRRLTGALPSGSYLVLSDGTEVVHPAARRAMTEQWNEAGENPRINRSPAQYARFFDGLDLLEPGVVSVTRWRPDAVEHGSAPEEVDCFGGVARKP